MKRRSPNFKLSMVDSIGDLILILGLNLSIVSPYYQGGRIWMNFRLSKCFIWDDILERHAFHSQNILAQSFCTGSDHPGLPQMIRPNSDFQHWVSPDDPTLVRMIRAKDFVSTWKGQAGWSGRTPDDPDLGNSSVFLAYSVSTLDDPRLLRMIREPPENTQRSLSGVGVYIPLHPLHLLLSLRDQPRLQSFKSFTSLHPRAWFLQENI